MKIKGSELNLFVDQAWPGDDWYWDHDLFDDLADPDTLYDTDEINGLNWQGNKHEDPTQGEGLRLDSLIRRWRKERVSNIFTVEVPKDKLDEFKLFIKCIGGKIT